jgi:endonuclease YncB( thermonuclease family)
MNKLITRTIVGILSIIALTGCGSKERQCIVENRDPSVDFVETPYTDALKLPYTDAELANMNFAYGDNTGFTTGDGVGFVDLRQVTDGDTANFMQDGYADPVTDIPISIKTRFLGINTPESTAKMEPWGKKASRFTKQKLEEAQANADAETERTGTKVHNIVLIHDKEVFGEKDSSGNRWLAFVWYRTTSTSDWRNLNLELVEQAYSRNQLFLDSDICNYRTSFEAADAHNKKCGYRVYGETDIGFDYKDQIYETTLWNVVNNFDELGADDESATSGYRLHIAAQVVGIQGDNMYLRDIVRDTENGQSEDSPLQVLYCYAGFNTGLCSILQTVSPETEGVGVVVYFYARATKYSGNIQLTDLQTKTSGKLAFKVLTPANIEKETLLKWDDLILDISSETIAPSSISTVNDIAKLQYHFINIEVELRTVSPSYDDGAERSIGAPNNANETSYWFRETDSGSSKAYTYYARVVGTNVNFNLRCDASLFPTVTPAFFDPNYGTSSFNMNDVVGHRYHVTGYVVAYFENFQLQLPNNYDMYNYIYKI